MRVLFVTNGNGEAAIAERIALAVHRLDPQIALDHFALVGEMRSSLMHDVGPRRAMPSGGLIAMGNVGRIAQDIAAGLLALTFRQYRFLRSVRGTYRCAVAVGDVYALLLTLATGAPVIFVGTAKSVNVAPYGRVEERVLHRARARFVRDEATATSLRAHGLPVEAANVIADLVDGAGDVLAERAVEGFAPALALFPGSRESAYDDAGFLLDVVKAIAPAQPALGAVLSIAGGLEVQRFASVASAHGWDVQTTGNEAIPLVLSIEGRPRVRAWRGALGPLLARVTLVLGQAGTANEAAAAAGVPVVAFERDRDRKSAWYRRRQRGLLGEALAVFPGDLDSAADGTRTILADSARRERMRAVGRSRMGEPGAAHRIAERIAQFASDG